MDRYWLLTNTFYGTWLPGKVQGFVGQVWDHRPDDSPDKRRVRHDAVTTDYDADTPGLERAAMELMKGPPIILTSDQASALFEQLQETARFRGWELRAVAIMHNHVHIVVGVNGDPDPSKNLGDFKSWGTRKLSERFGAPPSKTWWTERGSKRKLQDETAISAASRYVIFEQPSPLLTWSPETGFHFGLPPGSVEASIPR
jgi:REP element-mobilizing transposase RayT